ncbi:hypothetical protein LCGC14_0385580 [marine sediment metagenome]|uniref:YkgJ family cysteine cluster protein n=1 Tax=marine sediment metagenome TaxID=412755 RepID=A0A0F9VN82_9ZZZZ|nr:MAG: hypothetical protein Lokiarch_34140 [Candidatus Lokiarchaeum sp. GC14_75]
MCGTCCHKIPEDLLKRIPLYPDEADKLIELAESRKIDFKIIEDLVFPDLKNEKILVLTYRIKLDNESNCCPFYDKKNGCTIQYDKPMACRAYPLALKRKDAFNFSISIDPYCNFVANNYKELEVVNLEILKKVFNEEYSKAEDYYRKNKKLMYKIRKLEVTKKIDIPRNISLDKFDSYLKNWDRMEIRVK